MEFMDGVSLIKECTELSGIGFALLLVIFLIIMVLGCLFLFGGMFLSKIKYSCVYEIIGCILGLALVFTYSVVIEIIDVTSIIPQKFQKPTGKYEVVLDKNVDINEFYEKYEIFDFKNGVYTVTPKENIPQPPVNTHEETTVGVTTEIDGKIYEITPIK
ncbi:MAG: hypothetical protein NC485_10310 [Ruminococcus flavefaciens]|nr:hypothetical protein [Ruminococcus flavefaciens]MCM1059290.1 hypothetical protein [Eubacterium sp.]